MVRILRRSAAAALGLTLCLAAPSARADAPVRRAPGCTAAAWSPACRNVRPPYRADARAGLGALDHPTGAALAPNRYVSLLILGIGY